MATVAENLQTLINIKKGIKDAINDKGGTVTDSTPYADYATEIENLPSGGEDIWKGLIDRSISGDIRIPNDITSIGNGAFRNCTELTSVDMPNVTSIGASGFTNCLKLTSVDIPNVTEIGTSAFYQCSGLTSVDMPNVTNIGASGFTECYNLVSVDTPKVTEIGASTFTRCTGLTSVDMSNVTNIGTSAFSSCSGLTSLDIPNVTSIGASGFTSCNSILSVNFRDMFTIGNASFYGCSQLTDIYSYGLPATITYTGTSASFRSVHSGGTLHVPSGFSSLYTQKNWLSTGTNGLGAQNWTIVDDLPEYEPQNVLYATYDVTSTSSATKISNQNMSGNTQALYYNGTYQTSGITTGYTFGQTGSQTLGFVNTKEWENMTSSTYGKFYNITTLLGIVIPNNFKRITDNTFYGCTNLLSVDMPNVTEIGMTAFFNCSGLTSIDLSNVTSISQSSFSGCKSLTSIDLSNVTSTGYGTFKDCTSLTSIEMPNVTYIGPQSFSGCTSLSTVVIDNPIPPTLGVNVFINTASTLKIYVPDEAVDAYKNATNWTSYASKIYPLSQKP